ncbi:MAG: hypothetical protein Q4F72_12230, partial [Desulfovibrionaceae bacterium]|nr:hypothetical protein [Desulfovibrionaceae bacterium]
YRGRKFDRGLDDPRRQENPQKAPPRRDAASGRAKTQILPADPYLWVAAGRVRASRGLDDAQTASLPKAAPRPETAAKRARQAADPTDRICAAAREAHADSGPRITRLSLYGPGGLKEVRLEGLGRFTFVECGRAADPAALIEGLLLLAVFRHPGAALRLPAVRGLPQTAGYARDTLYRLVGEAPNAHVTVCAD